MRTMIKPRAQPYGGLFGSRNDMVFRSVKINPHKTFAKANDLINMMCKVTVVKGNQDKDGDLIQDKIRKRNHVAGFKISF